MKKKQFNHRIFLRLVAIFILILVSIIYISLEDKLNFIEAFNIKKEVPIYSVDRDEKIISISFDAAWGDDYTLEILDILDEYDVKTTFFLVGFWVDKFPDHVKEIHSRGHEIGNHSTSHPKMSELNVEKIRDELLITNKKIEDLTGVRSILFRPPFGDYNNLLLQTAKDEGFYTIQWDIDSLDWKELGAGPVVDRVTKNVRNGSIVLFHNNAKYVLEYLPQVLEKLISQGYEIVPISQLIYKDNYFMDNTGRQISN